VTKRQKQVRYVRDVIKCMSRALGKKEKITVNIVF